MGLNEEIQSKRTEIHSDGYPMSIGELTNLYREAELDIHPEFQRYFRWSDNQKSRLIESLLLGIPIPSIFVSQRQDGVWDVIDGLQRLATIFQFLGILKDADGSCIEPLTLTATKYLPSLEGKTWENEDSTQAIGKENQLIIRRTSLDIKIILRESTESSKYELFQRLNTGGSQLSDQEIRNVLLIMVDPEFHTWMIDLAHDHNFKACISLSDRAFDQQYDVELAVRFLAFRSLDNDGLRRIGDVGAFLDETAVKYAESAAFNRETEEAVFKETFAKLATTLGDDSFRRYDPERARYSGPFLISAFEVLAIGTGHHIGLGNDVSANKIKEVSKGLWQDKTFRNSTGGGVSASRRIPVVIPYGRKVLA